MKRNRLVIVLLLIGIILSSSCGFNRIFAATELEVIFNNNNIYGVQSGPTNPTEFTINTDYVITKVVNYHYFNNGTLPGTIALKHSDGTIYGPWKAEGSIGQGNVDNAYWTVILNEEIKAGTYTIVDSDPSTWSTNADSDNRGFTIVEGYSMTNNESVDAVPSEVDNNSALEESSWVLVEIRTNNWEDKLKTLNDDEYWQTTVDYAEGTVIFTNTYIGPDGGQYGDSWMRNGIVQVGKVTWTKPSLTVIKPDDEFSIQLTTENTRLDHSNFAGIGSISAQVFRINSEGEQAGGAMDLIDQSGNSFFTSSVSNGYAATSSTVSGSIGAGAQDGEQMTIRVNTAGGLSVETWYVYEWKIIDPTTVINTTQDEANTTENDGDASEDLTKNEDANSSSSDESETQDEVRVSYEEPGLISKIFQEDSLFPQSDKDSLDNESTEATPVTDNGGFGNVGNIPGPENVTEAIVAVTVPSLIAVMISLLSGIGGGSSPLGGNSVGFNPLNNTPLDGSSGPDLGQVAINPRVSYEPGIISSNPEPYIDYGPEDNTFTSDLRVSYEPEVITNIEEPFIELPPEDNTFISDLRVSYEPEVITNDEEPFIELSPEDNTFRSDLRVDDEIGAISIEDSYAESTIYDAEGYDAEGYDAEGYDAEGYDAEGYDAEGYDAEGYDAEGYDAEGYDAEGYNTEGYDAEGYNVEGYDAEGYNVEGYDAEGYNAEGYDSEGYNAEGYDAEGYNAEGYNAEGYDVEGYDAEGYDAEGYNAEGYNAEGYDAEGYNSEGYDAEGFNREDYDAEGYNSQGYNREGFNRAGYNAAGYDANGYNVEGYNKEGFNIEGLDREGYDQSGFNKDGYDRERFNREGFDIEGYNREGYSATGYNRLGYNKNGFNREGYDAQGYDGAGFNKEGLDRDGYNTLGFDEQGYDRDGFNSEGYNADGYNRDGFDATGYDVEGYDVEGYNAEGYDRTGYDRDGYNRDGINADGYKRDGEYKPTYDEKGRPIYVDEAIYQAAYKNWLEDIQNQEAYIKSLKADYEHYSNLPIFDPKGTPFDVDVIDADGNVNNPNIYIPSAGEDEYGYGMTSSELEALKKQIGIEEDKLQEMQAREPQLGEPSTEYPTNTEPETDLPKTDIPETDIPEADTPVPEAPETNIPIDTTPEVLPETETDPSNMVPNESELSGEPESMVLTTSNNGAQILIVKDPETGGWIDAETGNDVDLGKYLEESPEQFKRVEEFIKRNDDLEKSGQTAMQKAFDNIQKKYEDQFKDIQSEINKRRIEQLKKDMEYLEYKQQVAAKQNNLGKILGDTVVNIGKETSDAAVVIGTGVIEVLVETKEIIKDVWKYDIISQTAKATLADIDAYQKSGVKKFNELKAEIIKNPMLVVDAGLYVGKESALLVGKMGKAVVDTLRDPQKMLDYVKDSAGYNDILKSWDPNLNIFQRFKHLAIGGFKLGTTVTGVAKAGSLFKGKLSGIMDDLMMSGKKVIAPKGINPKIPTQFGPKYITSPRAADLDGITEASRKIIQNTADDFGVQIHTRPTTPYAKRLLEAGDAMPKPAEIKAKTLSKLDELIGGPKYSDGVVGYYKPKLPSKEFLNKLPKADKEKLVKLYAERRREFTKLAKDMKELESKGYKVVNKKIVKDGKLLTGDVDVYDITNYDGTPINPKMKEKILDIMKKKSGSNIMHEDLVSWAKKSNTLDIKAKAKMLNAASGALDKPKGLTSFNPLSKVTNSVHFDTPIPVNKIDNFLEGKLDGITPSEIETLKKLIKEAGLEG